MLQDDFDRTGRMLLTPAFTRAHDGLWTYGLEGLVLTNGSHDFVAIEDRIRELQPVESAEVRDLRIDQAQARRALRPLSISLVVFGMVAGIASVVLAAQAASRMRRPDAGDASTLRVLGGATFDIGAGGLIAPAVAIAGSLLVALAVAVGLSPLMPLGPVREVSRRATGASGFDVDTSVLLGGLAVAVIVLGAVLAGGAMHDVRAAVRRSSRAPKPSRLVGAAASRGRSPTVTTGLRMALERERPHGRCRRALR